MTNPDPRPARRRRWAAALSRGALLAILYFPLHARAFDRVPAWDFDDGGLTNPAAYFAEHGRVRYPIYFRSPDGAPYKPLIYGPVHFWVVGAWLKVAGVSGIDARIPALCLTFGTIWLTAETVLLLAGRPAWLAAVLLLCTSHHFHWLARTVRPEPSQVFWAAAATYGTVRALRVDGVWWIVAGLAAAASFLSHFIGAWVLIGVGVCLISSLLRARSFVTPAFWLAVAAMTLPPIMYAGSLSSDEVGTFLSVLRGYHAAPPETDLLGILRERTADQWRILPLIEGKAWLGFTSLNLPAWARLWQRSWLVLGLLGSLLFFAKVRDALPPSTRAQWGRLLVLMLSALLFIVLAYPNKQAVYIPGGILLVYAHAAVLLGFAWERWRMRRLTLVLAGGWIVCALTPNLAWYGYLRSGAAPVTPFDKYGRALSGLMPADAGVFGRGTWWPWLQPRPYTTLFRYGQELQAGYRLEDVGEYVVYFSPLFLELDYERAERHHLAQGRPARAMDRSAVGIMFTDWRRRPLLGSVIGHPYQDYHVYGPRSSPPGEPSLRPQTIVLHYGAAYRLVPFDDAGARPVDWRPTRYDDDYTWEPPPEGAAHLGTLRFPPGAEADWHQALIGFVEDGVAGLVGHRVRVSMRGVQVRFGYHAHRVPWYEQVAYRATTHDRILATVIEAHPFIARNLHLWVQPQPALAPEEGAWLRIEEAEYLRAESVDLETVGPGSLLGVASAETAEPAMERQ